MKNIFYDAEFDTPYMTRNGKEAIFVRFIDNGKTALLMIDGRLETSLHNLDGTICYDEDIYDIISKWKDENKQ